MTLPTVTPPTSPNSGTTGAVTYALPTYAVGDLFVLPIECGATAGVTPPAGWAHVTGSPRAQGSNVISLSVLWRRAESLSEVSPTVAGSANHQVSPGIIRVRGGLASGDPWVASAGNNANSTAASVVPGSSATPDTVCLAFFASSIDASTDQFGAISSSALGGLTKIAQAGTTNGNGGSITVAQASRSTAGSYGTLSATQVASAPWVTMALILGSPAGATVRRRSGGSWVTATVRRRENGQWVTAGVEVL